MRLVVTMPEGVADAYLAGDSGPGVLLYMDAIGLRPQIESMAERIASWGYRVLAPNVFWRHGRADGLAPTVDLRVPANRSAFLASGPIDRISTITPEIVRDDANIWLATLAEHGGAQRVGITGYCFGARLALRTAADYPTHVAAIGLFHGAGLVTGDDDSPHLVVPRVRASVLAGHADQDPTNTPDDIAVLDSALAAAGVQYQTAIYPGSPHGYTTADTSAYDETSAERHYAELRELFDRELHT